MNKSFPPPSTDEEEINPTAYLVAGILLFLTTVLLYSVMGGAVVYVAEEAGLVDLDYNFFDVVCVAFFVQVIRTWDRAFRR